VRRTSIPLQSGKKPQDNLHSTPNSPRSAPITSHRIPHGPCSRFSRHRHHAQTITIPPSQQCPPKTTQQPHVPSTTKPAKHGLPKPGQAANNLQIPIATHPHPHLRPHNPPPSNNPATPPPSTSLPPPHPNPSSPPSASPPTAKSAPSRAPSQTLPPRAPQTPSATPPPTNPPETGSTPRSKCSSTPCAANPSPHMKTT